MLFYYQWNLPQDMRVGRSANPGYPAHFHGGLEMLYLRAGRYAVCASGEYYALEAGDLVILFPYQIHEYCDVDGSNRDLVVVANSSALTEFSQTLTTRLPRCPVLLAGWAAPLLQASVTEMSAVGSLLIIGIGLNMLGLTKLKMMNYVPAIFLPILLCAVRP